MNDSILGTASALPSTFHAHTARSSLTTSVSDMERARARGDDLARRPSRAVTVSRANECERVRCILGTHPSISTTRGVDRARASRERPSANDSLDAPSLERRARTASRRRRPKTGRPASFHPSSSETVEGEISKIRIPPRMTDADASDANARDGLDRRVKSLVARVSESTARRAHDKTVTPRFVSALAELAFRFTETCARDVRAYARHDGKRDVVTLKDVELRARRAPSRRARRGDDGDGHES